MLTYLSQKSSNLFANLARERKARKPVRPVKDKLHDYLSQPVDDDVEDNEVLTWWAKHESEYPRLSRMARDYLSTPGEFVSCLICFLLLSSYL